MNFENNQILIIIDYKLLLCWLAFYSSLFLRFICTKISLHLDFFTSFIVGWIAFCELVNYTKKVFFVIKNILCQKIIKELNSLVAKYFSAWFSFNEFINISRAFLSLLFSHFVQLLFNLERDVRISFGSLLAVHQRCLSAFPSWKFYACGKEKISIKWIFL